MSLFVDASALVAIIAGEPERDRLADRVVNADGLIWSAMSAWETVSALRRSYKMEINTARRETEQAAVDLGLTLVPIGAAELDVALDAFQEFGRGQHPAKLNMGDCFAYACAKTNGARLLYKGDDFAQTDLA